MCRLQCHDWILAVFLYREYKSYCQCFASQLLSPSLPLTCFIKGVFRHFCFQFAFPICLLFVLFLLWQVSRKYFHISSCILYGHFSCLFLLFFFSGCLICNFKLCNCLLSKLIPLFINNIWTLQWYIYFTNFSSLFSLSYNILLLYLCSIFHITLLFLL